MNERVHHRRLPAAAPSTAGASTAGASTAGASDAGVRSSRRRALQRMAIATGAAAMPLGNWRWSAAQQSAQAQAQAQANAGAGASGAVDAATAAALQRGYDYLARLLAADGRFPGQMGGNVAIVSLAGLAWIAGGSLPGRGPYADAVRRAVDYVAGACSESGFIVGDEPLPRGPMYGQGFATLFLAEVLGMSSRNDLGEKLRAAVGLILRAQNSQGGWRYTPEPLDADLSVTISQMMALRAARNAGVYVPAEVMLRAVDYVRRSQNTDGGFMYQLEGGESRFPLTAGAIVALQNAGRYEGEELDLGYRYLEQRWRQNLSPIMHNYFFYAHYYAVQAMWQRGGQMFDAYYKDIRQVLLEMQSQDGSWSDLIGRHYGTAMACLILSAPNSLLPIFQR